MRGPDLNSWLNSIGAENRSDSRIKPLPPLLDLGVGCAWGERVDVCYGNYSLCVRRRLLPLFVDLLLYPLFTERRHSAVECMDR